MNTRKLTLSDVARVTHELQLLKLKSTKLFDFIVAYFCAQNYTARDMQSLNRGVAVRFLYSLAASHGKLDNPDFIKVANAFITSLVIEGNIEK